MENQKRNIKEREDINCEVGGLWEENDFTIAFNHEFPINQHNKCPHLINIRKDDYFDMATCPRVVVAVNEGGCNSTGICLDCLLEKVEELKKEGKF